MKRIEALAPRLQGRLADVFEGGVQHWMRRRHLGKTVDVRIVASDGESLEEKVRAGLFCRSLLGELGFLRVRVKPLRERREDIAPLVEYFIDKFAAAGKRSISRDALALCEAYDWPGNVLELRNTVAQLVVISEDELITVEDVLAHAPQLALASPPPAIGDRQAAGSLALDSSRGGRQAKKNSRSQEARLRRLARDLVDGWLPEAEVFHPAIERSLAYIAQNYPDPEALSLARLARQAFVSPSHLCFLCKSALGGGFTSFIGSSVLKKRNGFWPSGRMLGSPNSLKRWGLGTSAISSARSSGWWDVPQAPTAE